MSSMGKRVRVSTRHPRAAAVCDRCGLWANHEDLVRQTRWAGAVLVPTGLLVHAHCYDRPNPQLRTMVLPPDGRSIRDPRPEGYRAADPFAFTAANGTPLGTQSGLPIEPDRLYSRAERQFLTAQDGSFLMDQSGNPLTVWLS